MKGACVMKWPGDAKEREECEQRAAGIRNRCYIDDDQICILPKDAPRESQIPYEIPISDCSTPTQILERAEHLCEKTWMSVPLLRRFIHVATDAAGIDLYAREDAQKGEP